MPRARSLLVAAAAALVVGPVAVINGEAMATPAPPVPTVDQLHSAADRIAGAPSRRFFDLPNDPKWPKQAGYLDAVRAPTAWHTQHGSAAIKIAVVDSGIDLGHPDLAGKVVATYNARSGGTNITDTIGHGTFVSGVAAAATGNGVGVAGAGYDTSLIGVKVDSPDGSIAIRDEVAGIRWAAQHGANIINLSLGGPDPSTSERHAIEYAQAKGVLVVAAAGNDGDTVRQYPASYPGVVAVGATDTSRRTRADFSSYGSWVDLAAPGVGIYSTTPLAGSQFFATHSGYARGDGTSFSSPLVAGEAALVEAQNPSLTAVQVRSVLVASAHGYHRLGLGAGQADFALALRHTRPASVPSAASVAGVRNTVHLIATSSAATVAFRIDHQPFLRATTVSGGTASRTFPTWGYANGTHTLTAVDCTAYGECNTHGTTATFALANDAPTITAPAAGTTVTGQFSVAAAHPGGGGLRLLIGGHHFGFDAAAPYRFTVNGSVLTDTAHSMQVALCSTDGRVCSGPRSAASTVRNASLHPRIGSLSPARVSPNRDGVHDAGTLTFRLPDAESVLVRTLDRAGHTVRTAHLGVLHRGWHTWYWLGRARGGAPLRDGRYTLLVSTMRVVHGFTERGVATHTGTVDTHAPRLLHATGASRIYPHRDGYRDAFTPRVTLTEPGTLHLVIRNTRGHLVQVRTARRSAGRTSLTWHGRDRAHRRVAPGVYSWQFTGSDAAGNRRATRAHRITVSGKRLVTKTAFVTHRATTNLGAGRTARCASASHAHSSFEHGLRLVDGCSNAGFDFAYARYGFTMPRAVRYKRLAIQVYGRSQQLPSELTASLARVDGALEIPGYVKVDATGNHMHTIVSVSATGHLTAHRRVYATVILDSYYGGRNDFDLRDARIRISYVTLG